MFTELTPAQYIMAQLGAELGFDKESWSVRLNEGIKAFKAIQAGEMELPEEQVTMSYVQALRDLIAGKATSVPVRLDWGSSGPSILSAIMRDTHGMVSTGALANKPGDLYGALGEALRIPTTHRKVVKGATVPFIYGGTAGIKRWLAPYLGVGAKEAVKVFEQAYENKLPGAYSVRKACLLSWQQDKTCWRWVTPDGYECYFVSTGKKLATYELYTLDGKKLSVTVAHKELTTRKPGEEHTQGTGAHMVHALDAYILREIIRRGRTTLLRDNFDNYLVRGTEVVGDDVVQKCYKAYQLTGVCSMAVLEHITQETVVPAEWYDAIEQVVTHLCFGDYPVLPVHDEFGTLADKVGILRRTANAVYADLYKGHIAEYWQDVLEAKKLDKADEELLIATHGFVIGRARNTISTERVPMLTPWCFDEDVYKALLESDYLIC